MTIMANQKGQIPANIRVIGTSGAIDFTTKTLMPSGGEIMHISSTITTMIPNQTRSHPRVDATGKTTGRVKTIIAIPSRNVPRKT